MGPPTPYLFWFHTPSESSLTRVQVIVLDPEQAQTSDPEQDTAAPTSRSAGVLQSDFPSRTQVTSHVIRVLIFLCQVLRSHIARSCCERFVSGLRELMVSQPKVSLLGLKEMSPEFHALAQATFLSMFFNSELSRLIKLPTTDPITKLCSIVIDGYKHIDTHDRSDEIIASIPDWCPEKFDMVVLACKALRALALPQPFTAGPKQPATCSLPRPRCAQNMASLVERCVTGVTLCRTKSLRRTSIRSPPV